MKVAWYLCSLEMPTRHGTEYTRSSSTTLCSKRSAADTAQGPSGYFIRPVASEVPMARACGCAGPLAMPAWARAGPRRPAPPLAAERRPKLAGLRRRAISRRPARALCGQCASTEGQPSRIMPNCEFNGRSSPAKLAWAPADCRGRLPGHTQREKHPQSLRGAVWQLWQARRCSACCSRPM